MGDDNERTGLGILAGPRGLRLAGGPLGGLALLLVCLAVYLPGLFGIPVVDRDEARFAQASRQMFESLALPQDQQVDALHSGGVVVPRVQGRDRLNKPPLIYWLQVASAWAFTGGDPLEDAIWMYRIPSVLGAIVAVFATWRLGCSMFDARVGWLAAVFLAICPMVVWDAHQARADEVLLAWTTLSVWALWSIWSRRRVEPSESPDESDEPSPRPPFDLSVWLRAAALWICIAMGIMTKGPITPLVVGLTAASCSWITRDWRWLRRTKPILGVAILAAVIAPWIFALAAKVGLGSYLAIVWDEVFNRSRSAKEGHWGPPGYHLLLLAPLFWPGCILTAVAFVRTCRLAVRIPPPEGGLPIGKRRIIKRLLGLRSRWKQRVIGRDNEIFPIAWVLPAWIVMELVSTKLPHYVLPLYPGLALLSAKAVIDATTGMLDTDSGRWLRAGLNIWLACGVALVVVAPIGLSLLGAGWIGIGVAAITAAACGFLLLTARRRIDAGFAVEGLYAASLAAIIFVALGLGVILPRARTVWISPRIVEKLRELDRFDGPIAGAGYTEDSMVFLTRGRFQRVRAQETRHLEDNNQPPGVKQWLRQNPGGIVIATLKIGENEDDLNPVAALSGYNYSRGKIMQLRLYERAR